MAWAKIVEGEAVEIDGRKPLVINDVQYTKDVFTLALANEAGWSLSELEGLGIYQIVEPVVPVDSRIVSTSLTFNGSVVTRVAVLEPLPEQELAAMKASLLASVRQIALGKIGDVVSPDQQLLIVLAGLEGILLSGLDRATWPAALRNTFNPLFTAATTDVKAIYQVLKTKQAEIEALTTAAQMSEYDVNAGWPA